MSRAISSLISISGSYLNGLITLKDVPSFLVLTQFEASGTIDGDTRSVFVHSEASEAINRYEFVNVCS